jgi:hypothetical protein
VLYHFEECSAGILYSTTKGGRDYRVCVLRAAATPLVCWVAGHAYAQVRGPLCACGGAHLPITQRCSFAGVTLIAACTSATVELFWRARLFVLTAAWVHDRAAVVHGENSVLHGTLGQTDRRVFSSTLAITVLAVALGLSLSASWLWPAVLCCVVLSCCAVVWCVVLSACSLHMIFFKRGVGLPAFCTTLVSMP